MSSCSGCQIFVDVCRPRNLPVAAVVVLLQCTSSGCQSIVCLSVVPLVVGQWYLVCLLAAAVSGRPSSVFL